MSSSLQSMLEQLKNAQIINLSDMYIGDDGARLVATHLQNNKNIKQLQLKGNHISAQGIVEIMTALRACPMIKLLILDWNNIGSDYSGIESIAVFLVSNKSLQHLSLTNNKISVIEPLCNALRQNTTLLSLDLRWNDLRDKGGKELESAIRDNKALLYLDLNGTNILRADVESIDDILEQHRASNPIQKNKIMQIEDEIQVEEEPEVGFVGPSIVQHLEQMLEQERIHTMHIKQRMERELDELCRRDKADTRLLEELDAKSRQLESDNRAGQYQIEKLRDEYATMERQQEDVVRSMEEKIRNNEFILTELEKKHRSNLDRALNDNNFRIRDLNRDWENRCRTIEERSRQLEQENRILEEELRQLQERQVQLQITYDQELRDLGRRVQEEEYQKYHSMAMTLDSKIRAMEEARDLVVKRNADLAKDYDLRIHEGKAEMQVMYEELDRLKKQNAEFIRQSTELRNRCDALKQQAKVKEGAVEKYEQEINQLNQQIEQKRKMQADQLAQIMEEQQTSRIIWEKERIQYTEKVQGLEKTLRESHAENQRLRSEYMRLSEILQSNVSKALYQTFIENKYF